MKRERQQRSLVARLCALVPLILILFLVIHANIERGIRSSSTSITGGITYLSTILANSNAALGGVSGATALGLSSPKGSVTFTCPDGRIGLHIVHTRYLISQANAGLLFTASRLHLMETFMIPSLSSQTSRDYVLYASYDPKLSKAALQAFKDTLNIVPVHSVLNPETSTNEMALGFNELAEKLAGIDPKVRDIDLFVTSRLDVDDAAHVGAVEAIQKYACRPSPSSVSSFAISSDNDNGKTEDSNNNDSNVRVMYILNGTLWFPNRDPLGALRIPRPEFKIYKNLAVMQSMILSGSEFISKCKMDVYSYPHYKPQALEELKFSHCPAFKFDVNKDVERWAPAPGQFGWLYSKTTSSWTSGQLDHKKSSLGVKMDAQALEKSFAVSKGQLAVANLMFAGFAREAAGLLEGNSDLQLE
jgi:Putative rhamnosyl transferase